MAMHAGVDHRTFILEQHHGQQWLKRNCLAVLLQDAASQWFVVAGGKGGGRSYQKLLKLVEKWVHGISNIHTSPSCCAMVTGQLLRC